jgi:long-chain acyl-CoA synthetase
MNASDLAFLQYTGGTTGVSKGAMLTHRNMLANLEQTGVWISGSFKEGSEIVIAPLPMYHIFCLTSTLSFMKWGSLSVLITNPRDLPALVHELAQWKWSVMSGVNTLFNGLLHTPGFSALDFSSLKVVIGGGAAVQQVGRRALEGGDRALCHRSLRPHRSVARSQRLPWDTPWNGMIGLPFSSTEVSIRNEHFNRTAAVDR